ncbi:MAG: Mrp/NBP35 family ATP-binding protein [Planctomycetota bacterium]|jgi:ATP-binding protein involved in chromosome partitioning
MSFSEEQIIDALKGVQDPDLKKDLTELGMIKDISSDGDAITLTVELTTPACPLKDKIKADVEDALKKNLGAENITINMTADTSRLQKTAESMIPGVRNVVLIASGKGGVGKSTVAANVAISLSKLGARVGLLDADIYGPSLPTMFDIHTQPEATPDKEIIPHEKFGLKLMSMGFLLEDGQPVIWRGPMLDSALRQFLEQVRWGELDYLVVDMPPGTGDVQLSLARMAPEAVSIVVTTPQDVALADVKRAVQMFQQMNVKVLGVAENMSSFVCGECGHETRIFGEGAAAKAAVRYHIANLGQIPLTEAVVKSGDSGTPLVESTPDDAASLAFAKVAAGIAQQVAIEASATGATEFSVSTE